MKKMFSSVALLLCILFFLLSLILKEYINEGGENHELIMKFLQKWIKLMSPFCPHLSEELWEKLGNKEFISLAEWPKYEEIKEQKSKEDLNDKIILTVSEIIVKVGEKQVVKKIYIYVMPFEFGQVKKDKIEKALGKPVEIFAVNDKNKYDPDGRAEKAKPGKPGVYIE